VAGSLSMASGPGGLRRPGSAPTPATHTRLLVSIFLEVDLRVAFHSPLMAVFVGRQVAS